MVFTKRIGALAATALLGAGLSVAAPAAANAAVAAPSACGAQPALALNYSSGTAYFDCGTHFGNWWGTTWIYSGGHNYASVMLNDNGTDYNISINNAGRWYYPRSTSDDAVEVWIGS